MPRLRFAIPLSIDGFVADPSQSLENPLGIGGSTTLGSWTRARSPTPRPSSSAA